MSLFSQFGVELEYVIVDRDTLDVRPIADQLLTAGNGGVLTSDVDRGPIGWSNELSLHVIELKCNAPAKTLTGLEDLFQQNVAEVSNHLAALNAKLLPTGMHPWMDPLRESRLWPHDNNEIYAAFDRIFNCQGHGWSNLQALHLNLPFEGDEEFGRLHAAIRLILPLLPALAASTPIMEGRVTGILDNRLEVYRTNSRKIPLVAARVIPEPAFTQADYNRMVFEPLFQQIAPHDPEKILQKEWLNARGAIARFSRGSIEIRILDVQEHPAADVAICHLLVAVLKAMCQERWTSVASQQAMDTGLLADVFLKAVRDADALVIDDPQYLAHFGLSEGLTARELWGTLAAELQSEMTLSAKCQQALNVILNRGSLARRIVAATGETPSRETLFQVYSRLTDCLARGVPFER